MDPPEKWSIEDLHRWYEARRKQGAHEHTRWEDSRREEPFDRAGLLRKMQKWRVLCVTCSLHQDRDWNSHVVRRCPRAESKTVMATQSTLWRTIDLIEARGIGDFTELPWCHECHLPRSACGGWEHMRQGSWRMILGDNRQCGFRHVVGDCVALMLALIGDPIWGVLGETIGEWMDESTIRKVGGGFYGWLTAPMRWGEEQVPVMLRVFYQLDEEIERIWMEERVERRRVELDAESFMEYRDRQEEEKIRLMRERWGDEEEDENGFYGDQYGENEASDKDDLDVGKKKKRVKQEG